MCGAGINAYITNDGACEVKTTKLVYLVNCFHIYLLITEWSLVLFEMQASV